MVVFAFVLFAFLAPLANPMVAGATDFEKQPCDDHDPCTTGDRFTGGMCRGTPRACDDGLPCTEDFCDRASGRCRAGLRIDQCLIDGSCFREGESSPANRCLVCRAARARTRWTETDSCDDGDPCTLNDRCVEGLCEGSRYDCARGGECIAGRCDGRGGCIEELQPGYCRIDGMCLRDGQRHPTDACLRCEPSAAIDEWTAPAGASCPGGTCSDGVCLATVIIELEGRGGGRVVGPGFTCTGVCVQNLVPARALDLTVVPDNGSVFRGWRGACSGVAPCRLAPYGNMRVTAQFEPDTALPP